MLNRALRGVSRRYLLRHPWQVGLATLGIALGVAVVVAVDLANASAQRALEVSIERLAGRATHQLQGPPAGIPEAFYVWLRRDQGLRRSAPRVTGFGTLSGRTYELLGVDPFAEAPFGRLGEAPVFARDLGGFLARPGGVLLPAAVAQELAVGTGDTLEGRFAGIAHPLRVVGILPAGRDAAAQGRLIIADIATAQELLGTTGHLSGIDLILDPAAARALRERLPSGYQLTAVGGQAGELAALTRGFALNLTALSLLALIVGGFLIYNTMTFSVVQRRDLFGLLRAVGATRRQVLTLVLGEALVVGAIGTLIGLLAGVVLAQVLVQLVTRTINDLYFVLTVREFFFATATLVKGATLGLGVTLVVAAFPAWEAGRASPRAAMSRSLLEYRARRIVPVLSGMGVALTAAGAWVLAASEGLITSYAGLFAVVLGAALLSPAATLMLLRLLAFRGHALVRLAVRGITGALSRTSAAIAALMVAIAATVGMAIMVASFRATVVDWLDYHLRADVYVSVPDPYSRRASSPLDPGLIATLTRQPGVADFSSWRGVEVSTHLGPMHLSVLHTNAASRRAYRLIEGEAEPVWVQVLAGEVLVSESLAYRHGLEPGATLRIETQQGARTFRVAGIYYDYGSDRGTVLMARPVYERHWEDRTVSALGLYLDPGVKPDALIATLRQRAAGRQAVVIRSNQGLREASIAIFDRTFTITQVLRLLAMGVAFVAVVSALMAIQLERAREFAILRATGMTPGQLWRLMLGQTLLMGTIAGVLAMPVGVGIGWILTQIVNRQAFGWSVGWQVAPQTLLGTIALALIAALLAAIYPAWRMARTSPAGALREE